MCFHCMIWPVSAISPYLIPEEFNDHKDASTLVSWYMAEIRLHSPSDCEISMFSSPAMCTEGKHSPTCTWNMEVVALWEQRQPCVQTSLWACPSHRIYGKTQPVIHHAAQEQSLVLGGWGTLDLMTDQKEGKDAEYPALSWCDFYFFFHLSLMWWYLDNIVQPLLLFLCSLTFPSGLFCFFGFSFSHFMIVTSSNN